MIKSLEQNTSFRLHIYVALTVFIVPLICAHLLHELLVYLQILTYGSLDGTLVFIPMQLGFATIIFWFWILTVVIVIFVIKKRIKMHVPVIHWKSDCAVVTFVFLGLLFAFSFYRSSWISVQADRIIAGRDSAYFGFGAMQELRWEDALDFWIANERPVGASRPRSRIFNQQSDFYPRFELTMKDGRLLEFTSTPSLFDVDGISIPKDLSVIVRIASEKHIPVCIDASVRNWSGEFMDSLPQTIRTSLGDAVQALPASSNCAYHQVASERQLARPWSLSVKIVMGVLLCSLFFLFTGKRKIFGIAAVSIGKYFLVVCICLLMLLVASSY